MGRHALTEVLHHAYLQGIMLQSDYARHHCQVVAALASCGLITTREQPKIYGRTWRPTEAGVGLLRDEGIL